MSARWMLAAVLAVGCTPGGGGGGGGGDDEEMGVVDGGEGDVGERPVELDDLGGFDLGEVDLGEVDMDLVDMSKLDAEPDGSVGADAALLEGEACTNPDDTAALDAAAETLADTIGQCAFMCLGGGAPCATSCMEMNVGLGTPCATCFGQIIECTIMNCAGQCFDPSSPACAECREGTCNPAFVACAGIDPQ